MATATKLFLYFILALFFVNAVVGRPQDSSGKSKPEKNLNQSEGNDLKTANSYGFGYGLGYGYPYGYYGFHDLGYYHHPYYSFYGGHGYPFYG